MWFKLRGKITHVEIIAVGHSIRELNRLERIYGRSRWRKLKGQAYIQLSNGRIWLAEIHWYEAHGIGRKEFKIKRLFEVE